MRVKALLALIGLVLGIMLVMGCSDNDNENTRTITGTVVDAANNNAPVAGARVYLVLNGVDQRFVTTNANGQFTIRNVRKTGGYTLRVTNAANTETFATIQVPTTGNIPQTPIIINQQTQTGTVTVTVTSGTPPTGMQDVTLVLTNAQGETIGLPATTNANGQATFTNVPVGTNFTVTASRTGFTTTTSEPFTVTTNQTTDVPIIIVAQQSGNLTVTGQIGTVNTGLTHTVSLYQGSNLIAGPVTATVQNGETQPTFTLTNVPAGSNYFLYIDNGQNITIAGPYTIESNTTINVVSKTNTQLIDEEFIGSGIPPTNGTATLVAFFPSGSGTIMVNGSACTERNPAFITDVAPGLREIVVTRTGDGSVTFNVNLQANRVYVFRPNFNAV